MTEINLVAARTLSLTKFNCKLVQHLHPTHLLKFVPVCNEAPFRTALR